MSKIIKYYFRERKHIIIIISISLLLITLFNFIDADFVYSYEHYETGEIIYNTRNSPLPFLAFIAGALSTLFVIMEFNFKMNKISIDKMYSLPVKREKLYLSKLIFVIIEVLIPLTLCFLLAFLIVVSSEHMFKLIYFIPYYLLTVVAVISMVIVLSFAYTRGNSSSDGVINIIAYIFVFAVIAVFIQQLFGILYEDWNSLNFSLYGPLSMICDLMDEKFDNTNYLDVKTSMITSFIFYGLLTCVFFYLFIRLNKLEKSENTLEVSRSNFSYNFFIPVYSITFSMVTIKEETLILVIFIFIATYMGLVIKNKTFKLDKKDYLQIIIIICIGILFGIIHSL